MSETVEENTYGRQWLERDRRMLAFGYSIRGWPALPGLSLQTRRLAGTGG